MCLKTAISTEQHRSSARWEDSAAQNEGQDGLHSLCILVTVKVIVWMEDLDLVYNQSWIGNHTAAFTIQIVPDSRRNSQHSMKGRQSILTAATPWTGTLLHSGHADNCTYYRFSVHTGLVIDWYQINWFSYTHIMPLLYWAVHWSCNELCGNIS